jgi:hypothetical protein
LIRRVPVLGGPNGCIVQDPAGAIVGTKGRDGYLYTSINRRVYSIHRLIWLYVTGEWSVNEIDHKNGVRNDNRWRNLREATTQQNRMNTLGQKRRKGPYPGVYERARDGKFVAQIKINKQVIYLGVFEEAEHARQARVAAEERFFKQFAGSRRG